MNESAAKQYVDRSLEKAIIGAIISGREDASGSTAGGSALPLLVPGDFGDVAHAAICEAAIIASRDGGISPVAVIAALRDIGKLNTAGGEEYVSDLPFYGTDAGDPVLLVGRVKQLARARKVVEASERVARLAMAGTGAEALLSTAQAELELALRESHVTATFEHVSVGLERVFAACEAKEKPSAWSTGLPKLDWVLGGGLYAGTLNVFAARPGVGKTSLATQVAYYVAATSLNPCLMFSLEMPPEQIWQRVMSGRAHVPHDAVRRRETNAKQHEVMTDIVEQARKVPFYIHKRQRGQRKPTPDEMVGIARGFKQKHGGLAVLVVDYVQIATPPGDAPKHERIGEVTGALKDLAVELECAVIGISQFNRGAANERPDISMLAGSGSLESDADTVAMLYRPSQTSPMVELIVGKNRNGRTGDQSLLFVEEEVRFEESA